MRSATAPKTAIAATEAGAAVTSEKNPCAADGPKRRSYTVGRNPFDALIVGCSNEHSIREEILAGLLADKGGKPQISTAMCVLAEIIASDVSLLLTFN